MKRKLIILILSITAHEQGGYVDAEKIVWRDVCALVALDQIDFAGIVHNHFNEPFAIQYGLEHGA